MGVTIAFRGLQRDRGLQRQSLAYARGFAREMEWRRTPVELRKPRGLLGRQILEMLQVDGLILLPHFACEPVPLLFLESTGHLVDSYFQHTGDDDVRLMDEILVKTQFAGPAVHAEICAFLADLKNRFVPGLEVDDETEFFRTGDATALALAFESAWTAIIDALPGTLAADTEYTIGGFHFRGPLRPPPADPLKDVALDHCRLLFALEEYLTVRYGGLGLRFDRQQECIENLDLLMHEAEKERWFKSLDGRDSETLVHSIGATFGHTLAALLGGHWTLDENEGLLLRDVGGVGLVVNPFQVAADRVVFGPSHGFAHHFTTFENLVRRLGRWKEP
jgi:hypothetical protein